MDNYDDKFYEYNKKSSSASADTIFPFISKKFSPKSVIDFGCGRGIWLDVANKHGVAKVVGLDGDWNRCKQINSNIEFIELKDHKKVAGCKYDLAISFEVFEHLEMEFCIELIETMTQCSDIIIFSAAFISQRGTLHINEQYPSFWAKKFISKGFQVYDIFRPKFWGNSRVDFCYQQNMFLYINQDRNDYVKLFEQCKLENLAFMDTMHPGIYLNRSGRDAINDFKENMFRVLKKRVFK